MNKLLHDPSPKSASALAETSVDSNRLHGITAPQSPESAQSVQSTGKDLPCYIIYIIIYIYITVYIDNIVSPRWKLSVTFYDSSDSLRLFHYLPTWRGLGLVASFQWPPQYGPWGVVPECPVSKSLRSLAKLEKRMHSFKAERILTSVQDLLANHTGHHITTAVRTGGVMKW